MSKILNEGVRFLKQRTVLVVAAMIGLAAAGVGPTIANASVPDAAGAVHACYQTGGLLPSGQTRIIDSATAACNTNETAINLDKATPGNFVTNLVGADFTGADLSYRNFIGQDMHNATLTQAILRGSDLTSANLSGATIMSTIDFTGAKLLNTNFSNSQWTNGGAIGGDFQHVTLTGAQFSNSTFDLSNFRNVDFTGANVFGGSFGNNTDFTGATLTGVTWSNTVCPDNTNSDSHGNTCVGHLVP